MTSSSTPARIRARFRGHHLRLQATHDLVQPPQSPEQRGLFHQPCCDGTTSTRSISPKRPSTAAFPGSRSTLTGSETPPRHASPSTERRATSPEQWPITPTCGQRPSSSASPPSNDEPAPTPAGRAAPKTSQVKTPSGTGTGSGASRQPVASLAARSAARSGTPPGADL